MFVIMSTTTVICHPSLDLSTPAEAGHRRSAFTAANCSMLRSLLVKAAASASGRIGTVERSSWEDLLRLAGSLKLGRIRPRAILHVLRVKDRPTSTPRRPPPATLWRFGTSQDDQFGFGGSVSVASAGEAMRFACRPGPNISSSN